MTESLRIVFMGTPDFAAEALKALLQTNHKVIAVYSQPPRPKGRGQQVQKSPVHELAEQNAIPVFTPPSLKNEGAQQDFASLKADVAVVAAYGLILPKAVLDSPKHGCLNIHASLLPRWRGAAPIQRAILAGDVETGITIMQMNEGLDTGPMIESKTIPITHLTTAQSLHDDLACLGGQMIVDVLNGLEKHGRLCHVPQPASGETYAAMLKKEEGKIDWSKPSIDIDRQIRALNPWPGTWCMADGKRMKVLSAKIAPPSFYSALSIEWGGQVGGVLGKGIVTCGQNTFLQLVTIQPENKAAMDVSAAMNGGYLKEGFILV